MDKPTLVQWKIAAERAKGIWPEDESIDDFLDFLRESRGWRNSELYVEKRAPRAISQLQPGNRNN
jgi:hypothetical protein